MAKTLKQKGEHLDVTAPSDVSSGDVLKVNSIIGICQTDAKSGESVALAVVGVHGPLAKATGETWAIGEPVYWDESASEFTKTSTSNTEAGVAASAAGSTDAIGDVRLGLLTQPGA